MYEILYSPFTSPAAVATIARCTDEASAVEFCRRERRRWPAGALVVFYHISQTTKVVVYHTL